MSLNRYAKKRDIVERPIIRALERMGMDVMQLDRPVDLIIGFRKQNYLLEVKTGKAKLNEDQSQFVETWRGHVTVVRSVDDAIAWAKNIRAGIQIGGDL